MAPVKLFARIPFLTMIFLLAAFAGPGAAQDPPPGRSGTISGDIFEQKGQVWHYALSLSEQYCDNIYYTPRQEESDYITRLSPALALALPGIPEPEIQIQTATTAPGGLTLSRNKLDSENRFQGILTYNPVWEGFADNSGENFTSHQLKGALQYNAPGGLSLDLAEQYTEDREWILATSGVDDDYMSNLGHAMVEFEFSPKFSLGASLSYYQVAYDDEAARFRDRRDKSYAGMFTFQMTPKTSLFAEYQTVKVSYDEARSDFRDNTEERFLAGLQWKMSAKSQGRCKLGYSQKDFSDSRVDDPSGWYAELDVTHKMTTRTMIKLGATRQYAETNIGNTDYYISNQLVAQYTHEFTPKLKTDFSLSYSQADYEGLDLTFETVQAAPRLSLEPYHWLTFSLGYSYEERQADEDNVVADYDYVRQSVEGRLEARF